MNKLYRKITACAMAVLITAVSFAACSAPVDVDQSGAAKVQEYPVTVNEVTVKSKPAKVAVLNDSLADVVLAMGYETSLIAAADTCNQKELETLQKVSASDDKAVVSAGADLIISDSFSDAQKAAFDAAGITCVAISGARNREDFERLYMQVGSALNGASTGYNEGLAAAQNIFSSLDDLSRIIPKSETVVTGCYLFDTESRAVTGEMLISTVMSYAGITNVFKGSEGGTYDLENLKITNPQYIFCPVGMKDTIAANPDFKNLTAVKNGNVIEAEESLVTREGRGLVSVATLFAGAAYPELLEESSASATAKVIEEESSAAASEAPKIEPAGEALIKKGDNSNEVFELQAKLFDLGYITVEYDGLFGDVTETAVKAFQKANNLEETGAVDAKTLEVLDSGKAVKAADAAAATPAPTPEGESETSSEPPKVAVG